MRPKIVLTRGIPASGKSTFAKAWVQEDPGRRVRVNRDNLRQMLFGSNEGILPYAQEQQVSATEFAIAKDALGKGKDVVIDATHLRDKHVKRWFTLGYDVEFRDFEVPLETALERNAARDRHVPEGVIEKFFDTLTDGGRLRPAPTSATPAMERYQPDWSLPKAIIVDVDGTLAHIPEGGRSPYDYSRVHEDVVDENVRHLVNEFAGSGHHVIILSGREDDCRKETLNWLTANGVIFDELYMRKSGDKRKDATVKAEIFNALIRDYFNVVGVIDDRNQVVRMWRDLGLKCYQAQEGAF